MLPSWRKLLNRPSKSARRSSGSTSCPTFCHRPRVEALEDRLAPAVHTWTGAVSGSWLDDANWTGNSPANDTNPQAGVPRQCQEFCTY
jgi:hypothetical protein